MKKRLLACMLALTVFCSSVVFPVQKAQAIAVVDDALVYALAGALIAGAGYYVSNDCGSNIIEAGESLVKSDDRMDSILRHSFATGAHAGIASAIFTASNLVDLSYIFDKIGSVFGNGGTLPATGQDYVEVKIGDYSGYWYGQVARVKDAHTGVVSEFRVSSVPRITAENATIYYMFNSELKSITVSSSKSLYPYAVAGNFGIISIGTQYWIGSEIADGKYRSWDSLGSLTKGTSDYVPIKKLVACPPIPDLPIDTKDIFRRWKDSILDGNDVICRPKVGIPISNWKMLDRLYAPDGVIQNVDVFGDGSNVAGAGTDGIGQDVITDWGLEDVTDKDMVALPDGVFSHAGEIDGATTGEGAIAGYLGGLGAIMGGVLAHVKALPTTMANTISNTVVGTGNLDFSKLRNCGLVTVFPFCIPFDIVDGIKSFSADGVAPEFTLSFEGTIMSVAPDIVIDMSKFEVLAKIIRFFVFIGFALGLAKLTRGLIKG